MDPRLKMGVVFSSMLVTVTLVVGAVLGRSEPNDDAYRPLAVYTEVLNRIKADYVEEPDVRKVTRGALQGLVEYLDPLSSYLTAEQFAEYQEARSAPDGGTGRSTGMVVHKRGSYTVVLAVIPGSPADRAGILAGDFIEAIDDVSTRVMPPAYLNAKLSGESGSTVRLLIRSARHYDEPEEIRLTRSKVAYPEVEWKMLNDSVGYVKIPFLTKEAVDQTAKAARALEKDGASRIVLDLRENALGDAEQGFRLADLFVSEGRLGLLKGQQRPEQVFEASAKTTVTEAPLIVLADRFVSGGAELAVAALADRERASIVGERTYGLASDQEIIPLEDGAHLILSTAKYYRENGKAVQDEPLQPEYPLDPRELRRFRTPEENEERGEDPFIKKALEVASGTAEPVKRKAA